MLRFLLLVLLVGSVSTRSPPRHAGSNENRIVGGDETPLGTFMFVSLLSMFNFAVNQTTFDIQMVLPEMCSSSIVSKRHIVTAAHCVTNHQPIFSNPNHLGVNHPMIIIDSRPREKIISPPRAGIPLANYSIPSKIYYHPGWNFFDKRDDVAVLEFPEGTDFGIEPITLANDYTEAEGDIGMAAGYGLYDINGSGELLINPPTLRNTTVPIHNCNVSRPQLESLRYDVGVCAGMKGRMAESGDSGGPLMIERNQKLYQIGSLSYGLTADVINGVPVYESHYARTSKYCGWIEKVTKKEVQCQSLASATASNPPPPPAPTAGPAPPPPGPSSKPPPGHPSTKFPRTSKPSPPPPKPTADPASNSSTDNPEALPQKDETDPKENGSKIIGFNAWIFLVTVFFYILKY